MVYNINLIISTHCKKMSFTSISLSKIVIVHACMHAAFTEGKKATITSSVCHCQEQSKYQTALPKRQLVPNETQSELILLPEVIVVSVLYCILMM